MDSKKGSCTTKTSAGRGQTIVRSHGRDNSSYDVGKASKMGGSTTNLSHSISGSSANQRLK